MKNFRRLLILEVLFAFILSAIIFTIVNFSWAIIFFFILSGVFAGVYFYGDRFILFIYRAELIPENEAKEIYLILTEIVEAFGTSQPKLYALPSACANAFALRSRTGELNFVIGQGLFRILQVDEMKAVFAYLFADCQNDEIREKMAACFFGSFLFWFFGIFSLGVKKILGIRSTEKNPKLSWITLNNLFIFHKLLKLQPYGKDVYLADQISGRVSENPLFLASALWRMDADLKSFPFYGLNPPTACLFILNPFVNQKGIKKVITHPEIEYRLRELERQAKTLGL